MPGEKTSWRPRAKKIQISSDYAARSDEPDPIYIEARALNPSIKILVRARYLAERSMLEEVEATARLLRGSEAAVALADCFFRRMARNRRKQEDAELVRKEWEIRRP
jgi:hypothetical protein